MKKLATSLLVLILLVFRAGLVLAGGTGIDFNGSLETDGIIQTPNNDFFLGAGSLAGFPTFGGKIKWQNDLRVIPSDQVALKFRVSYLNDTTQPALPVNNQFVFSRGFIDFTPGGFLSLRVGKQRLAWGTGYAWNPTDILDQPRNAFTDVDDPEGVMAFRTDLNFGPVTAQLVVTPDPNPLQSNWESSGRALRLKASPGGVDLSCGLAQNGVQTPAEIADFACSISGVGLHGEARYQPEGNIRPDKSDIFNYLIGVDYNIPGGYYVALEYYHNDQAYKNITELQAYIAMKQTEMITVPPTDPQYPAQFAQFQAFVTDYLSALGNDGGALQDHIFLRGQKKFGDDINIELMLVYGPADGSLVGQPKFEYIWGQNTSIFVKGLFALGDSNSEAGILPAKNSWNLGMKVNF